MTGYIFDDSKNKLKLIAEETGVANIAAGAVKTATIGNLENTFNDPNSVMAVANLKYNVGEHFAVINTGVTMDLSGHYSLSVQIKNIGSTAIENALVSVIMVGY